MNKTLAIALGGVTVVGLGLFAYLKLAKKPISSESQAITSTSPSTTPPASTNGGLIITDAQKLEEEKKEKELAEQELKRPATLNNVQAISYAIDKPESMGAFYKMSNNIRTILWGKDTPIEAVKKYWKEKGRPKGDTVRVIVNSDQTPATLTNDQAIIYLATYPEVRKVCGFNLTKAKENWVANGIKVGRKIDLY